MIITYDPKVEGSKLSEEELIKLRELNPDCNTFTSDDPELTDELVEKMKNSAKVNKIDLILNKL